MRFGDTRVMALTGALCVWIHAVAGFTNKSLRSLVAGLLGHDYTTRQMTYLRRLRLHGVLQRLPHTNTYVLTSDGLRAAIFYNKVHARVLRPLDAAAHQPPAPIELRHALTTVDHAVHHYLTHARLTAAACNSSHRPSSTPRTASAVGQY